MIKMTEQPAPRELIKQLNVIHASWEKISKTPRNFNMQLERKPNKKRAESAV